MDAREIEARADAAERQAIRDIEINTRLTMSNIDPSVAQRAANLFAVAAGLRIASALRG